MLNIIKNISLKLAMAVALIPLAVSGANAMDKNGGSAEVDCLVLDVAYGADGGASWAAANGVPICDSYIQGQGQYQVQVQVQVQYQAKAQNNYAGSYSILNDFYSGGSSYFSNATDVVVGGNDYDGHHDGDGHDDDTGENGG